MLSVLFALMLLSYFAGTIPALGAGIVILFFYGSAVLYKNVMQGMPVEAHSFMWLVFLPGFAFVMGVIGNGCHSLQTDNRRLQSMLGELATVDETTGLENTQAFYTEATQYIGLSKRHKLPLSLMLVRLVYYDDLKSIAGENGMKALLKNIARQLVLSTRVEDSCYRLEDGRTFGLLLFTDQDGMEVIRKRIRETIKEFNVEKGGKTLPVRIELKMGSAMCTEEIKDALSLKDLAEKDMEYDL